jgi:hypothetical protein
VEESSETSCWRWEGGRSDCLMEGGDEGGEEESESLRISSRVR